MLAALNKLVLSVTVLIMCCRGMSEYPDYSMATSDTSGLASNSYIA